MSKWAVTVDRGSQVGAMGGGGNDLNQNVISSGKGASAPAVPGPVASAVSLEADAPKAHESDAKQDIDEDVIVTGQQDIAMDKESLAKDLLIYSTTKDMLVNLAEEPLDALLSLQDHIEKLKQEKAIAISKKIQDGKQDGKQGGKHDDKKMSSEIDNEGSQETHGSDGNHGSVDMDVEMAD